MKKFRFPIFVVVVLLFNIIFLNNFIDKTLNSKVQTPSVSLNLSDYSYSYASIGKVIKAVNGRAIIFTDDYFNKSYSCSSCKEANISVKLDDFISLEDTVFKSGSQKVLSESDGKIISITKNGSNYTVIASDFKHMIVKAMIAQQFVDDIRIGNEVLINYNDYNLAGTVTDLGKEFDSNQMLSVTIKIEENSILRPGAVVDFNIVTYVNENALTIDDKALISIDDKYYVDVFKETKIERRAIEIGTIGIKRVEVVAGLRKDEIVLLKDHD